MSKVTVDATTERPADEVIELAGSGVVLRWLPLSEGRARAGVVNLNGLLRALFEQRDLPGGVLVAVEPCGQVVGAAVLCLGGGGAKCGHCGR